MVTLPSLFNSCLVPEGETQEIPEASPWSRSHSQILKDAAEVVLGEEFVLSFPDPLCIFPLISTPARLRHYSSAPLHHYHQVSVLVQPPPEPSPANWV